MNEGNLKFAAQHEAIVEAYKESKAGKGMYCTAMALIRPATNEEGIECLPLPDTANKLADVMSAIVGKDMKKALHLFKDHKIVVYVEKLRGEMIDIGEIIGQ